MTNRVGSRAKIVNRSHDEASIRAPACAATGTEAGCDNAAIAAPAPVAGTAVGQPAANADAEGQAVSVTARERLTTGSRRS